MSSKYISCSGGILVLLLVNSGPLSNLDLAIDLALSPAILLALRIRLLARNAQLTIEMLLVFLVFAILAGQFDGEYGFEFF